MALDRFVNALLRLPNYTDLGDIVDSTGMLPAGSDSLTVFIRASQRFEALQIAKVQGMSVTFDGRYNFVATDPDSLPDRISVVSWKFPHCHVAASYSNALLTLNAGEPFEDADFTLAIPVAGPEHATQVDMLADTLSLEASREFVSGEYGTHPVPSCRVAEILAVLLEDSGVLNMGSRLPGGLLGPATSRIVLCHNNLLAISRKLEQ
jgi:hypothetical protein